MSTSAYDWFLAVEMARAEGEARRQRLMQEKDSFRRRASRAKKLDVNFDATALPMPRPGMTPELPPTMAVENSDPSLHLQLALGHEPVMVRLVSFAAGPDAVMAQAERLLRQASRLETQDSVTIQSRAAISTELQQWSGLFDDRSPSQDVIALRCPLPALVEESLATAFAGHDFAWQLVQPGSSHVQVILVLAGGKGQRLAFEMKQGQWQFTSAARKVIALRLQAAGLPGFDCVPQSPPLHGQAGLRQLLRAALARGSLQLRGAQVTTAAEARQLLRLWTPRLRSHGVRDSFNLLITAARLPASAAADFRKAVAQFLHEVFADHRFFFAVHHEGRMQARALVAMRSESGAKLRPDRSMFETWRRAFAAAAQARGLKLLATQSYATVEAKPRLGQGLNWAVTPRQRARATAALAAWRDVVAHGQGEADAEAANQTARLEACLAGGAYLEALMAIADQARRENAPRELEQLIETMEGIEGTAKLALGPAWGQQFAARAGRVIDKLRHDPRRTLQLEDTDNSQI